MEAYKYTTWHFPDDYEGKVTATFIERHSEQPSRKAVLYIHGYLDYFFKDHMAECIVVAGWNFYAWWICGNTAVLIWRVNIIIIVGICRNTIPK